MNFWMAGCLVSLTANLYFLVHWRQSRRRERERNLHLASLPSLNSELVATKAALARATTGLSEAEANLRSLSSSPLIGVFLWEELDASEDSQASQGIVSSARSPQMGSANAAFLGMIGAETPPLIEPALAHHPGFDFCCKLPENLFNEQARWDLKNQSRCGPVETDLLRPDGTKITLALAAELRPGYPRRTIGIAIDITNLKVAKRELHHIEDIYRALAESSPLGIWNIRTDGRTLYINPAMVTTLELESAADLTTTQISYEEFFTPESLVVMRSEQIKRSRGKGSNYEVEIIGRWGKRTRMLVYGTLVYSEDGTVESLMGTFLDITERKREEEALRQSEERLRVASECGNDLIYEWDLNSGKLEWFGPVEQRLGFSISEIPRSREAYEQLVHPEDRARVLSSIDSHLQSRETFLQEYRIRAKDGNYRLWSDRGTALWDAAGIPGKWIGSATDVTEARQAEDTLRAKEVQLRQAQKLEAVGRLAGGIAHDFNNLLAAIMGYCELMLIRLEPDHTCRREVKEILSGSDRAAALIRQLLAFSRQEIPQPKVLQPGFIIRSMERMLQHLMEKNIGLRLDLDEETGCVRIDPVQMEQVIMNLILNARDAMPAGGGLWVKSCNIYLEDDLPGAYGKVHAGPYVKVSVSDSGLGIDLEHLPHIFDPFYTTKDKGKGNGLGLSTVYGIIIQNQGCISVETEVSKGSTFSFFLPRTSAEPENEVALQKALRSSVIVPRTVLVVEDESEVRGIVRDLLSQQGYMVLEANHGKEALALVEQYSLPIHLLITDVVMPEMGGKELADEIGKIIPGLRVLFMSGYTQDHAFREEVSEGERAFIQKPFSMGTLVGKIREVMA